MKIGVWGYGTVGKSVVKFLLDSTNFAHNNSNNLIIQVLDKRELKEEEKEYFNKKNIKFCKEDNINLFFEQNDKIICSPGVDLNGYLKYQSKIITELDLFNKYWKKPIIAVTGTVGKTSTVHLLSNILKLNNYNIITGGNIGFAMLDFIEPQDDKDFAVLEVSSFQLEYCKNFSPDLAIWTNFYPNHLDRHKTLENYFNAKLKIILNQHINQKTLLPIEILPQILKSEKLCLKNFNFFCSELGSINFEKVRDSDSIFTIEANKIIKYQNNNKTTLLNLDQIPNISFAENWLVLVAACDILNITFSNLLNLNNLNLPNHRLCFVAKINNVEYYNDSKSTLCESTLAAVNSLNSNNIHLFLGGTSKGVDRSWLIEKLKDKVKAIYCFGKENQPLYDAALKAQITSFKFYTVEDAFDFCNKNIKAGDIVLFSPAGASYDQFLNFEERGQFFVNLVNKYKRKTEPPAIFI